MWYVYVRMPQCMWRSEDDPQELILSSHFYRGSGDWSQFARLEWQEALGAEPSQWPNKDFLKQIEKEYYDTSVRENSDLAGDVAQWVEYLLSMQHAPGLVPSVTKTRYGAHL